MLTGARKRYTLGRSFGSRLSSCWRFSDAGRVRPPQYRFFRTSPDAEPMTPGIDLYCQVSLRVRHCCGRIV